MVMVPGKKCYKYYDPIGNVPKNLGHGYCLRGKNKKSIICSGDSGGALFWEEIGQCWYQAYLIGKAEFPNSVSIIVNVLVNEQPIVQRPFLLVAYLQQG